MCVCALILNLKNNGHFYFYKYTRISLKVNHHKKINKK